MATRMVLVTVISRRLSLEARTVSVDLRMIELNVRTHLCHFHSFPFAFALLLSKQSGGPSASLPCSFKSPNARRNERRWLRRTLPGLFLKRCLLHAQARWCRISQVDVWCKIRMCRLWIWGRPDWKCLPQTRSHLLGTHAEPSAFRRRIAEIHKRRLAESTGNRKRPTPDPVM